MTILTLLILAAAGAAAAGEEDYECPEETSVCIRQMVDHIHKKGWIGIEMKTGEGRTEIERVLSGSPAEAAGLRAGDVIAALDGVAYSRENEKALHQAKKSIVPGRVVTFTVERDGRPLDVEITVGQVPEHILAQWVGQHVMEHHMAEAEAGEEEAGSGFRP